jgi:hypothetical protein
MISLSLIVLRTTRMESLRVFYDAIGLTFVEEQHGTGPIHYACELDGVVIELYPTVLTETDSTMLGFNVESLDIVLANLQAAGLLPDLPADTAEKGEYTFQDPDGRRVQLTEVWE